MFRGEQKTASTSKDYFKLLINIRHFCAGFLRNKKIIHLKHVKPNKKVRER